MMREEFSGMQEGHVYDLLPGYALGCLDAPEEGQVAEHLASCEHCRAELKRYEWVAAELPMALEISAPPPDLKARILTRACQSAQPDPQPLSAWQRFRGALQRSAPAWGLAGLAVVILLAVSNLLLWQRLGRVESAAQASLRTVALASTDFTPGATGELVISRDGEYGVLVVDGLPSLDEARQYQLWLIQDGQRTSGGVFSVNPEGYGVLYITSPNPLASYQAVGITIEPAGGSPGPTGEKVLGGDLEW
jgi:anti-sigma-K factor RskA